MSYKNKDDMNEYLRKRYYRLKDWAIDLLGGKCSVCSSVEGLEIDHKDPSNKKFNVSESLRSKTKKEILEELAKCQLLCCTCHKEKTKTQDINSGEKNPSAKLKDIDIPIILKKIDEGLSLRNIAKDYGISHVTVLAIKKNRTWKNLRRVDRVV